MDGPASENDPKADGTLELGAEVLSALKAAARPRRLARGETLIKEGSAADALYFVLSGRLTVIAGGTAIAEIGSGEPVGEVAFFGGGTRSASVVAARASEILELTRAAYGTALAREPGLSTAIIAALARRLRRAVPSAPGLRPRPARIIGVVPGGQGPLDRDAVAPLLSALGAGGAQVVTGPEDLGGGASVTDLAFRGDSGQRVVLCCDDPESQPNWADELFQHCDTVMVCLDRRRGGAQPPSPFEKKVAAGVLGQNIHLVLLRSPGTEITGTADWLSDRTFGLHHHMAAGDARDAARIARIVQGRALGVVLGGGGAFGTAQLGMLKALGEAGVEVDMVGGTSVGAAMAAAFAMGLPMDEVMDRFVEMFVTSGAATRYTFPFWSILDHAPFDAQLKHHYGAARQAEDLPINFYALATSLTRNAPRVLRRGTLWELIRASSAIPAVFPPMVRDDGEVFVDGGLFDNVPVEAMRSLKPGPNLVLRLEPKSDWRVHTDYSRLPSRTGALRHLLLGRRRGGFRFPGIASVMNRSMVVNSELLQAQIDPAGDVFVDLPRIRGMGFMEWKKGRALFDKTYAQTAARLEALGATHSGVDLLRALASPESSESG